jgi:hypothetical protein
MQQERGISGIGGRFGAPTLGEGKQSAENIVRNMEEELPKLVNGWERTSKSIENTIKEWSETTLKSIHNSLIWQETAPDWLLKLTGGSFENKKEYNKIPDTIKGFSDSNVKLIGTNEKLITAIIDNTKVLRDNEKIKDGLKESKKIEQDMVMSMMNNMGSFNSGYSVAALLMKLFR